MKRKVLATVLGAAGLVGLAASSYGQGIIFDNYTAVPYFPVVYGSTSGGLSGTLAGNNVSAELGYFLGTSSDTSQFTLLPSSIIAIQATTPGYFVASAATVIPGYISGPVSFEILLFTTSGTLFNNSLNPEVFTEQSLAVSPSPANSFTGLYAGGMVLNPVPEPTTLALAGLGGLASLVAFRRKQS